MRYVYLPVSRSRPDRRYVGITKGFVKRLAEHNAGLSPYARKHRPWQAAVVVRFRDDGKAEACEKYLKRSGSGHFFAKRRFW